MTESMCLTPIFIDSTVQYSSPPIPGVLHLLTGVADI